MYPNVKTTLPSRDPSTRTLTPAKEEPQWLKKLVQQEFRREWNKKYLAKYPLNHSLRQTQSSKNSGQAQRPSGPTMVIGDYGSDAAKFVKQVQASQRPNNAKR